jgi:hypothetical protein
MDEREFKTKMGDGFPCTRIFCMDLFVRYLLAEMSNILLLHLGG